MQRSNPSTPAQCCPPSKGHHLAPQPAALAPTPAPVPAIAMGTSFSASTPTRTHTHARTADPYHQVYTAESTWRVEQERAEGALALLDRTKADLTGQLAKVCTTFASPIRWLFGC